MRLAAYPRVAAPRPGGPPRSLAPRPGVAPRPPAVPPRSARVGERLSAPARRRGWPPLPLAPAAMAPVGRVRVPGRDGAQVAADPGMDVPKLPQLAFADPGALREKPLEHPRTGPERRGLPHQRAVTVEGLAEGGAERHRLALVPGAGAQLVPGRQNLCALGRERVHRRAMAPAVDRMANLAGRCAPARCRWPPARRSAPSPWRLVRRRGRAWAPPPAHPATHALGDVIERRLLGLRARPALGQIRPDVAVGDGPLRLVLGPVLGDVEGERRPVDVDVERLPVPCGRRIDGLPRRPVVRPAGKRGPRSAPGPRRWSSRSRSRGGCCRASRGSRRGGT